MAFVNKTLNITITPGTRIPAINNTITCTCPIPGIVSYRKVWLSATKAIEIDISGGSAATTSIVKSVDFLTKTITFTITTTMHHGGTPVITAARLIISYDAATYMNNYFAASQNSSGIGNWLEYNRCTSSLTSLPKFKVPLFEGCLRYPSFPSTITNSTYSPGGFIYGGRVELSNYFKEDTTIYSLERGYIPHYAYDCVYSDSITGSISKAITITIIRTDAELSVTASSGVQMANPTAADFPGGIVPHRLLVSLQAAGGGGSFYSGSNSQGGGSGARWTGIINISNNIGKVIVTLGMIGWGGTSSSRDGTNATNSTIQWYDTNNSLLHTLIVGGGKGGITSGLPNKALISGTGEGGNYWTILEENGVLGGKGIRRSGENVAAASVYYVPSSFNSYLKCKYSHDAYVGGSGQQNGGGAGGAASASSNGATTTSDGSVGAGGGSGAAASTEGGRGGLARLELSY